MDESPRNQIVQKPDIKKVHAIGFQLHDIQKKAI